MKKNILVAFTGVSNSGKTTSDLPEMKRLAGEYDDLFIEGLKSFPVKRIGVFREEFYQEYIDYINVNAYKDLEPSYSLQTFKK